jgi:hypothetical protein
MEVRGPPACRPFKDNSVHSDMASAVTSLVLAMLILRSMTHVEVPPSLLHRAVALFEMRHQPHN